MHHPSIDTFRSNIARLLDIISSCCEIAHCRAPRIEPKKIRMTVCSEVQHQVPKYWTC